MLAHFGAAQKCVYVCVRDRHQRVFVSFISFIWPLQVFTVADFLIVCWGIDLSWTFGVRV